MKTLQELYNEVLGSDELKKSLAEAISGNKVEDFLKPTAATRAKTSSSRSRRSSRPSPASFPTTRWTLSPAGSMMLK